MLRETVKLVSLLIEGGLWPTLRPAKRPDSLRRRPQVVSLNLVRTAVMLRRSVQPSEAMTCEVSFNLVRYAEDRQDSVRQDQVR
jgi:hypothetical protein